MLNRILIPLDGSAQSGAVTAQLRQLLQHPKTEVFLLYVASARSSQTRHDAHAQQQLDSVQATLAESGTASEVIVRNGSAAEQIARAAQEHRIDLIAMSSHGRSGIQRLVRGSVAERVLRTAPCPALVVTPRSPQRTEADHSTFGRILVPIDIRSLSPSTLQLVSAVATIHSSQLTLLHVVPGFPTALPFRKGQPHAVIRSAAEVTPYLEPLREKLETAGIRVHLQVEVGAPGPSIVGLAKAGSFDLVLMACHGRSGAARLVYGSVTEHVLRRCTKPLLLVRASDLG